MVGYSQSFLLLGLFLPTAHCCIADDSFETMIMFNTTCQNFCSEFYLVLNNQSPQTNMQRSILEVFTTAVSELGGREK